MTLVNPMLRVVSCRNLYDHQHPRNSQVNGPEIIVILDW